MKVGVVKRVVVAAIWELLAVCVCVECRSGLRGESENCLRVTITDAPGNAELSLTEGNKERLTTVPEEEDELVLNAEVTESGGEITAFGKLSPLTVTALHRNIAERDGKVRLCFDLQVSPQLLSSDRQLRILPILVKDKDTALLDRIFITGETYRSQQLKGYGRYNRYFASIIPDSVDFLKAFGYLGLLKCFTERNLESGREGEYGVTEDEAVDYYIKHYLVRLNRRRKDRLEEVFRKCVKDPIDRLGIRLDTVLSDPSGGLVYRYVQDLAASRDMRRLKMFFMGSVHSYGNKLYSFTAPDTLTWYVSSLTQLADTSAVYRKQTLARDVEASTLAYIEFAKGSWEIDTTLGNNSSELERIRREFDSLSVNRKYTADSVIICASCSPDGSYTVNQKLSHKRAEAVTEYFSSVIQDKIRMHTGHIPENWELLKEHIVSDSNIRNREAALAVFREPDLDKREYLLSKCADFKYIREKLYPLLRRIDFTFRLHRRIYDTVKTEVVLDESYREGMRALMERDFKKAVGLLRPYSDINTAIAYLCLGYNASALNVLEDLDGSPRVHYLTALVYSRLGDDKKAREYYGAAIREDPRLRFRSALDPEMERLMEQFD